MVWRVAQARAGRSFFIRLGHKLEQRRDASVVLSTRRCRSALVMIVRSWLAGVILSSWSVWQS